MRRDSRDERNTRRPLNDADLLLETSWRQKTLVPDRKSNSSQSVVRANGTVAPY